MKLLQSFYPTMLPSENETTHWKRITDEEAMDLLQQFGVESCLTRGNFATILSDVLDMDIFTQDDKRRVVLKRGEQCLVAQYDGPYLREDDDELPFHGRIIFWFVTVNPIQVIAVPEMTHMALNSTPE